MRASAVALVLLLAGTCAAGSAGANSVVDAVTRAAGPLVAATDGLKGGLEAQAQELARVPGPFATEAANVMVTLALRTTESAMQDADFVVQTGIEDAAYLTCEPPALGRSTNWIVWGVGLQSCARSAPAKAGEVLGL